MKEESNDDKLYKNIISMLRLFKNRPYHLAKYLMENKAFNNDFIRKIVESDKLTSLESEQPSKTVFFDISSMNRHFDSLIDDISSDVTPKSMTVEEINSKLDQCLREDRFEDAIRIRDYMKKNNIKRI